MMLKGYQIETLETLRRFLEEARVAGPKAAYEAITKEPERAARLGGYAGSYEPLAELPGVPYVCLRLPTGGGKTILGAHAVSVVRDAWMEEDCPLVLWLAPTNVIRRQTADALKKPWHPYRRALDEAFGGGTRVFDIADFGHLRPGDARDRCCVVVGTIQTLRVTNTEGRKVYAHHEDMEAHFSALSSFPPGLERMEDGGVKFSFANFLHLRRPLMIVDEAHNAVTGLTRETQRRVNPCAIVEFTATPRPRSNILHSVSAQELKDEEMIKLPVALFEHDAWQAAVNGALAARASLAEKAKAERDYARPIVLFQAQKKNQEVTVEVLKKHLMEAEGVPEERIAVATGAQRELDGVDLLDPKCPVECVITVEALKEGWDCSFAYVFCSVSRIRSATDVEQLLGRVLRMPYAKRRSAPELNKAYAHLCEPSFGEAARALVERMTAMGFEEREALDNIEPQGEFPLDGGPFAPKKPGPRFIYRAPATEEVRAALADAGVAARETAAGEVKIEVAGWMDERLEKRIAAALPEAGREDFSRAARAYRAEAKGLLSPAERGERIVAPRLMARIQGELEFADADVFMEFSEWSPLDHPARLEEGEFAVRETARGFEIDLDGKRLSWRFSGEEAELPLDAPVEGWTPEALVRWLDRETRAIDITQSDLLRWLSDLVGHLTKRRGIGVAALTRCKFILARAIRRKIDAIRRRERGKAYQAALFGPEAGPEVSFDRAFVFEEGMYLDRPRYRGSWRPGRGFLPLDQMPAFDGAEGGEETRCARALDSLPGLKHWVRNADGHPRSFWLPTASDRFYPDFVAEMEDGRLLVVEYKGEHLASGDDAAEKRAVGDLWEKESGGLFIMVEKEKDGKDMRAQLLEKIGDIRP